MQQGRYDADITVTTTPRPNNRVELLIDFIEGKAAKVFDINIIGNTVFKESDIKQAFAVKESGWSSVISRNDRYARVKDGGEPRSFACHVSESRLYQL